MSLRGWEAIVGLVDSLAGGTEDQACRVIVGMHVHPDEAVKELSALRHNPEVIDGKRQRALLKKISETFRKQLSFGVPTNQAEKTLRHLAAQLRSRKVFLKAFLRYPLHAKLYLVRRKDTVTPLIGFVGSSNLTLSGLSDQGELNVDVVDQDAANKLQNWFDERWTDELSIDLGDTLAEMIETSWAREGLIRPYLIYLKIAHNLSEEARIGEKEFRVPKIFNEKGTPLLDFQKKAASLAAHCLNRRRGVLLGDVVGLGKTLMATAIAKIFEEDDRGSTLVLCPPKLMPMWQAYLEKYEIYGKVLSIAQVGEVLDREDAPSFRLLIIDESHNLRNREGKRYRVIRSYIKEYQPRVLLLTATPYNKHFSDLSSQLKLFVDEDENLRIRPERFLREWVADGKTESEFISTYSLSTTHSLKAFDQSTHSDDWRDLMRLFLVRRTRQFIIKHYAKFDKTKGRYYVLLNGEPKYFPLREPRVVEFSIDESDPGDQYARLFDEESAQIIGRLSLPRYGMASYIDTKVVGRANPDQKRIIDNLNRAGRRLIGFCRTNLFKRLESSGHSFLLSLDRHILRNMVALYAIEKGLDVPIGTQNAALLDTAVTDEDEVAEFNDSGDVISDEELEAVAMPESKNPPLEIYRNRASAIYDAYSKKLRKRFDWLPAEFFTDDFRQALIRDSEALLGMLDSAGPWDPDRDAKLYALIDLVLHKHPDEKVIIFTQFADTALYLGEQLRKREVKDLEVVTNSSPDPVSIAHRFSPQSNGGLRKGESELRILISTDVLAEGQNLQDAHIIVNYDLPWAIIRLIQRAGRVDRIGQQHDTILVYSFMPADGVERIIRLRQRLFARLAENQEVIGTDETFFGEQSIAQLRDLDSEKPGILDDDTSDDDIDLSSLALQVWNSASAEDQKAAIELPPIVYAARAIQEAERSPENPPGVIAYLRYPDRSDTLVRVDDEGNVVSQSVSAIFRAAGCGPDTEPLARAENHHHLVEKCVEAAQKEQVAGGGQLGPSRSPRRQLFERLERYRNELSKTPLISNEETLEQIKRVLNLIYNNPLTDEAGEAIKRQLKLKIADHDLLEIAVTKMEADRLCVIDDEETDAGEPQIICSMGLISPQQ